MRITEKQIDALAGRVAELEGKVEALLGLLATPKTLERLGLDKIDLGAVRRPPVPALTAHFRHRDERETALKEARRDELVERLKLATQELDRALPAAPREPNAQTRASRAGRKNRRAS